MKEPAIVLTNGVLDTKSAKTAHGLIRGSERFQIVAVIDEKHHGQDAGTLLDGLHRNIPVISSVTDFISEGGKAQYCIIGIAPKGGLLPDTMRHDVKVALKHGISVVSGLHSFLNDDVELRNLAQENNSYILDIRKPRPKSELAFWTGEIHSIRNPKLAVMGTDCGLGKRTTAKFIVDHLREEGRRAEMIFTGQTGWMQGWKYGFILDSTYNDFVSGELEHAIVSCAKEENPDLIVVEGQAALRNISGPCGAEFLVSGSMDGVILHHAPARKYYHGFEELGIEIPPLSSEIALIKMYGVDVIGITLNTNFLTREEAKQYQQELEEELGLPVALPIEEGISRIMPAVNELMERVSAK